VCTGIPLFPGYARRRNIGGGGGAGESALARDGRRWRGLLRKAVQRRRRRRVSVPNLRVCVTPSVTHHERRRLHHACTVGGQALDGCKGSLRLENGISVQNETGCVVEILWLVTSVWFTIHSFCFVRGFFFCCGMGELGGGAVTVGNHLGVLGPCFYIHKSSVIYLCKPLCVHMSQKMGTTHQSSARSTLALSRQGALSLLIPFCGSDPFSKRTHRSQAPSTDP
jgi:hypothetical protein